MSLHHAERSDLPERPYRPGTWEEVRLYARSILDLLVPFLDDNDPDIQATATDALLASFRPLITYSLTAQGLAELGRAAFAAIDGLGRSAANARTRERVVSELELLADDLLEKAGLTPAQAEALERSNRLHENLTEDTLQARLWRWAGPLSWRLRKLVVEASPEIVQAVHALASHLVHDPPSFEEHLDWLTSEEAERRFDLFLAIGREDRETRLLHILLQHHDSGEWPQAFSAYIVGRAAIDRPRAETLLDELAALRPELVAGVLRATSSLSSSSVGVDRILRLLNTGAISHQNAVREISPLRWDELIPDDFERLIRGLDDGTPDTRVQLLWPFLIRLARDATVTLAARDLAWSFLSSTVASQSERRGHDWDFLAAKLGSSEPERLRPLIEALINSHRTARQSLSFEHELPLVWRTLATVDRGGLVLILLRAAMASDASPQVDWQLEQMLNPAEDADILLDFAHAHGVEAARTVAGVLDAAKGGFWDVGRRLLSEWGHDDTVRERLLSQVGSGAYAGSAVPLVTARLEAARRLLSDGSTKVATWARDVVEFLEDWQRRAQRDDREEWVWDYRIRRAELERMVRSADSPQHLWAIGRLLKDAPVERVRELLTPEEILEALPRLTDLDEGTRRKWTAYARHLIEH
jgi:hypothetical protein